MKNETKVKTNSRGSIALFVLFSGLFFTMFLSTIFMYGSIKGQTETETTKQAQEIYNSENKEEVYQSYFGEGNIPIYTEEQLSKIGSNEYVVINEVGGKRYMFAPDATYVLMGDIILSGNSTNRNWISIGTEAEPFTGTFEGNNCAIYNLYNSSTTEDNQGFFGYCENATIKNLIIYSGNIQANNKAGGIVGSANNTTIEACINQIPVTSQTNMAGGIAGSISNNSVVRSCNNTGSITCTQGSAGGIVGNTEDDTITVEQCTNTGTITATTVVE